MAFSVTLDGQDITAYTDQMSLDIVDALGQGSGAGSSQSYQGRAGTIQFDTSLGPLTSAAGAGQSVTSPKLVRQGEIVITDASGTKIWGGFATKYTDISTSKIGNTKQNFTTINGVDYEGQLARIIMNESYVAMTDVQIIIAVISKYAPWINLSLMPSLGSFTFAVKNFRNVSVLNCIQAIAGITGYLIWVDFEHMLHYVPPATAGSAPFVLSDQPDFLSSFPHNVQEFIIDDNATINRVTFYGGTKLSGDFTQDVSPLADGNNTTFPTAYHPFPAQDGVFHVTVNGTEYTVGNANGTSTNPANVFISKGGTAQALLNSDGQVVTFDTAPAAGSTIHFKYQYEFPLTVVLVDAVSYAFFGPPYLDGIISDSKVFDTPTAIQRSKVLLAQQSFGLTTLKIDCWRGGLQSGQVVMVNNVLRGLSSGYLIQEVETEPLGAGNFVFHLTLGAWQWNVVDVLRKMANEHAISDQSTDETASTIQIISLSDVAHVTITSTTWGVIRQTTGPYYARSTAVGDGHDAYCGFSTISSNS